MATPKHRRFQFSLMSLLIVITITALSVGLLSWLWSQMNGELSTIDMTTGPGKILIFQCADALDASVLVDQFDDEAFSASVRNSLAAEVKETPLAFYPGRSDNVFFVRCHFARWGKAADKRNADINQAIDDAGREYAASHSTVVKFGHSP